VLVHGVLGSSSRWPVLPILQERFTVYALERRGRGESGDAEQYAIEREFEDIAAVADSIGEGVNLLGHSYGGLCVLEAAMLTPFVHRLIVYEPGPVPAPQSSIDSLQELLDTGDREGMVTTFLRTLVEMPHEEIEFLKSSSVFQSMLDAAHTVPRELRAEKEYQFAPERFQGLNSPTLLLVGGDSPPFANTALKTWHSILPDSRTALLPGQQHIAHYTAPDLFAREVMAFLLEPE
jgi:pimeloyl-ACP methyl ester carboxylesterase